MFLNVFKVKMVFVVAGLAVLGGFLAAGGRFGPRSTIVIEYGMYPRDFAGLEVEIDGEVAGVLKGFGAATRTAFEVEDGRHVVTVRHPELECRPRTVTSGAGGRSVVLILDYRDQARADGTVKPVLAFQD